LWSEAKPGRAFGSSTAMERFVPEMRMLLKN